MTHKTFRTPAIHRPPRLQRATTRCFTALAMACILLPLAGCPARNHQFADARTLAATDAPLAWTLLGAHATHHLATSSMEAKDPAPGNQFVVLDVSVRNRDMDPQVLSEGKLIAMDESSLQTFDTPVTVLNDDYLSLQVLAPDESMRGKIAYEVPEHLPGVLYWSPGNGSKRILLNVSSAPVAPSTLAEADSGDSTAIETDVATTRTASHTPDPAAPAVPADLRTAHARTPAPEHAVAKAVAPPPPPMPAERAATVVTYGPVATATTMRPAPVATLVQAPPVPAPMAHAPPRQLARIDLPSVSTVRLPTRIATGRPVLDGNQQRRQQCEALVSRNDPSEKPRSLGFFAQSCREFALPSSWRPQPAHRSLFERATELLARVVVKPRVVRVPPDAACGGVASPADRLVCSDPDLAAMDRQLAQTVARARDHVDDPAALQRDQQRWRGRVRDACDTVGCLQLAYGRQIARVEALAPLRP